MAYLITYIYHWLLQWTLIKKLIVSRARSLTKWIKLTIAFNLCRLHEDIKAEILQSKADIPMKLITLSVNLIHFTMYTISKTIVTFI